MNTATAHSALRHRLTVTRRTTGIALLLALIALPVIATEFLNTRGTTALTTLLLWAFVGIMLPETIVESKQLLRNKTILVALCTLGACLTSWLAFSESFDGLRCMFMLGVTCCLPAAIGWFRRSSARGITILIWTKACVLAYAGIRLGIAILQQVPPLEMFKHPPIYRHLRHFNYDLSLMTGLALTLAEPDQWRRRAALYASVFVLGFFSFWSGGRGGVLAVIVMLTAWWLAARTITRLRVALHSMLFFIWGGLAVIASGETQFLLKALTRSSRETLNAISSNRLEIWMNTWASVTSGPRQLVFGQSPEAFVNLGVHKTSALHITHPHSAPLQWMLEYGLLGTAAIALAMLTLGWRHVIPHLQHGSHEQRAIAATLIGMSAFSLVDGIYYHAAPLVFLTVLLAYLISHPPATGTSAA